MSDKDNAQNVIEAYRKRQQSAKRAPIIIGIAAVILIVGAAVLIFWLTGPNKPAFFAAKPTDTPTPTQTSVPTPTPTITVTPTMAPTDTPAPSPTISPTMPGPFIYQVAEGDSCWTIAAKFKVDLLTLITINNLDPSCPIRAGEKLTIPGPDTKLPTTTPIPLNLPRGTKINYTVQVGDTVGSIALKFNSTTESILKDNNIKDANSILPGQVLIIEVNLVTPIPSKTAVPPSPTGPTPTSTRAATFTPAPTKKP
jgi:LysM repeat protein